MVLFAVASTTKPRATLSTLIVEHLVLWRGGHELFQIERLEVGYALNLTRLQTVVRQLSHVSSQRYYASDKSCIGRLYRLAALVSSVATKRYLIMCKFRAKTIPVNHDSRRRGHYLTITPYNRRIYLHPPRVYHRACYPALRISVKYSPRHDTQRRHRHKLNPSGVCYTLSRRRTNTQPRIRPRPRTYCHRIQITIRHARLVHKLLYHRRKSRGMLRHTPVLKIHQRFASVTQSHRANVSGRLNAKYHRYVIVLLVFRLYLPRPNADSLLKPHPGKEDSAKILNPDRTKKLYSTPHNTTLSATYTNRPHALAPCQSDHYAPQNKNLSPLCATHHPTPRNTPPT